MYRCFDAEGRLLYVGQTEHPRARLRQHRVSQPWWGEVVDVRVEEHPDRAAALAVEAEAIRCELPVHNKAGRRLPEILAGQVREAAVRVQETLEERDALVVAAVRAGGSLREVGVLAGLTHAGVRDVVRRKGTPDFSQP